MSCLRTIFFSNMCQLQAVLVSLFSKALHIIDFLNRNLLKTSFSPVGEITHGLFSLKDNEQHSRLQNYAVLNFQVTFRKVLK